MSNKKYFWLKLHKDFFKSKEIKKLRKIAGGDTFVIIYLKMQLLSIETNGIIEYEEVEPTFAEELALELDEEEANVNATLLFLESMGMLKEVDSNNYSIPHVVDLIGSETPQARSMRKKRATKNQEVTAENVTLLQDSYTPVTKREKKVTLEIELEKELDIDIDKEKKPRTPKRGLELSSYSEPVKFSIEAYESNLKALGKGYKKTDHAWKIFLGKVDKFLKAYGEQQTLECINNAIEGNWKTLYEPRAKNNSRVTTTANHVIDKQYEGLGF